MQMKFCQNITLACLIVLKKLCVYLNEFIFPENAKDLPKKSSLEHRSVIDQSLEKSFSLKICCQFLCDQTLAQEWSSCPNPKN